MELQPKAFQEAEGPIGGLAQIPWQTNDVNIRIFIYKLKSTNVRYRKKTDLKKLHLHLLA